MRLSSKAIQSDFPICKLFWSLQMPVCQGLPLRLEGRRLAGGQAAPAHGTASHVEPPATLNPTRMTLLQGKRGHSQYCSALRLRSVLGTLEQRFAAMNSRHTLLALAPPIAHNRGHDSKAQEENRGI